MAVIVSISAGDTSRVYVLQEYDTSFWELTDSGNELLAIQSCIADVDNIEAKVKSPCPTHDLECYRTVQLGALATIVTLCNLRANFV